MELHNMKWIYSLILLTGIFFKFYSIDTKYFWYDEVATISHTSGNQIGSLPPENITLNLTDYKEKLNIRNKFTLSSKIKGLFSSINLNPLHYVLLMFWNKLFGDGFVIYRYFSVFIFLITLPVLFLLGSKLSNSKTGGWILITIYSCSPYINLYSQEARYYILWGFIVILNIYLYFKVIETNRYWILFTLSSVFSLYISPLSGLTLLGLSVYSLFYQRKLYIRFFVSFTITSLLFLPWVYWLFLNRGEVLSAFQWHSQIGQNIPLSILIFVEFFVPIISFGVPSDFVTVGEEVSKGIGNPKNFVLLLTTVLLFYSIFIFFRSLKKFPLNKIIVFALIPIALFFIISDWLRNTGGSFIQRYQIINVIGGIICVGFLLSTKIQGRSYFFGIIYLMLITLGIYTMYNSSKDRIWSMKSPHFPDRIINDGVFFSKINKPLLLSDYKKVPMGLDFLQMLVITNEFKSKQIKLVYITTESLKKNRLSITDENQEIFLVYSSDSLVNQIKNNSNLKVSAITKPGMTPFYQIYLK